MTKSLKADRKSHIEIKLNGGSSILLGQNFSERCQLIPAFSFAGSVFPEHDHEASAEVLVVVSGRLKVIFVDDKPDEVLTAGDAILIPKGVKHTIKYLEDTRIWAVLCPPDKDLMDLLKEGEKDGSD